MAKRRKKVKSYRRRRSVGALAMNPTSPLVKFGSVVLGYLMAAPLNTALDGIIPASMKSSASFPKIKAAAEAGIGAYLVFGKGRKTLVKSLAGGILLGAGAKALMDSLKTSSVTGYGAVPVVSGYGAVPVIGKRKVAGYSPSGILAGYSPNAALNGQKPVHQMVMGSVEEKPGAGGSGYMQ